MCLGVILSSFWIATSFMNAYDIVNINIQRPVYVVFLDVYLYIVQKVSKSKYKRQRNY